MEDLNKVSDEQLIVHVLTWMANQTETGNGSVNALDRKEARERMIRRGEDITHLLPDSLELTAHDTEYVRRLREIAARFSKKG